MANDELIPRCELLSEAWRWWGATLDGIDEAAWVRATRLEGWDVKALVAHHSLLVQAIGFLASQPIEAEPAVASARDMLRGFNASDGIANTAAEAVAEMARQQADSLSRDELIARFTTDAEMVVAAVLHAGPIVIDYFGNGTFPITEVAAIAIMEAVVHGLDLRDAIGSSAQDLPDGPIRFTVDLLASLANPIDFIEAASGRVSQPILPVLR